MEDRDLHASRNILREGLKTNQGSRGSDACGQMASMRRLPVSGAAWMKQGGRKPMVKRRRNARDVHMSDNAFGDTRSGIWARQASRWSESRWDDVWVA